MTTAGTWQAARVSAAVWRALEEPSMALKEAGVGSPPGTSAGAACGQLVSLAELRRSVREDGGAPVERATMYGARRTFPAGAEDPEAPGPLDTVGPGAEERFSPYQRQAALEVSCFRAAFARAEGAPGPGRPPRPRQG